MLAMAKPRYFMPVHGEAQHCAPTPSSASRWGVPAERVFVLDNGDSLEMVRHKVRRGRAVESGVVYVDGGTVTEANPMVLRDRQKLGADGVVSCTVVVSKRTGSVSAVEVFGRGVSSSTDELLDGEAAEARPRPGREARPLRRLEHRGPAPRRPQHALQPALEQDAHAGR